jgi:plastocyanin
MGSDLDCCVPDPDCKNQDLTPHVAAIFRVALAGLALSCLACGGSGGGATSPSPPVVGTTVTITSSGVSPKNLQISPGSRVTFINNSAREHEMASDPHPEHTDCPAINQVGVIVPGQSKETGNLNIVRTCGYHDHGDPQNASLQGQITIQ